VADELDIEQVLLNQAMRLVEGDQTHFPVFDISGQHYVAVPERYCPSGEVTGGKSKQRPVGRIRLGEELHYLFGKKDGEPYPADVLTRRELQIAMLVADGKGDKQIARTLGISCYTVREHLRRTFSKLHVPNRSALVALVVRRQPLSRLGS